MNGAKQTPEINIYIYYKLMFDRGYHEHTVEKREFLQEIVLKKLDIHMQKNETRPLSHTYTKINSKQIKIFKYKIRNFKTTKRKYKRKAS